MISLSFGSNRSGISILGLNGHVAAPVTVAGSRGVGFTACLAGIFSPRNPKIAQKSLLGVALGGAIGA